MPEKQPFDRRRFLELTGAATAVALLAGCGGPNGEEEEDGAGDEDGGVEDEETPADADNETEADNETDGDGGDGEASEEVDEYLSDTDNYDGAVDETGSDEVTVQVGAEGNDGNFAFEPAAVRVSSGTDVVWEWTGEGGGHNVDHEDGEFESEVTDEEGFTFSHTFEEAGDFLYYCEPHRDLGMKGAVIAEE